MYTVYKHTAPNGKVYIGITKQKPEYRWNNGNGYIENKHFYSAIRSYKWENFKHDILETGLTKEQACAKEIELIAKYDSANREKGYNNSKGGECGALGVHPSAETRRKLSEAHKRAYLNPEYRRKLSEAHKGKHLNSETRWRISEVQKGKHISAETRRKLSEAHKGNTSRAKTVICVETGILYTSGVEAAKSIGVTQQAISNAVHGKSKTAGGYHWKYVES